MSFISVEVSCILFIYVFGNNFIKLFINQTRCSRGWSTNSYVSQTVSHSLSDQSRVQLTVAPAHQAKSHWPPAHHSHPHYDPADQASCHHASPQCAWLWYKQWKVRSGCLEKLAYGIPEGKFFRQPLRTFHCFSDFWINTVKNMTPRVTLGLTLNIFRLTLG